jgi:hypothetical protein
MHVACHSAHLASSAPRVLPSMLRLADPPLAPSMLVRLLPDMSMLGRLPMSMLGLLLSMLVRPEAPYVGRMAPLMIDLMVATSCWVSSSLPQSCGGGGQGEAGQRAWQLSVLVCGGMAIWTHDDMKHASTGCACAVFAAAMQC